MNNLPKRIAGQIFLYLFLGIAGGCTMIETRTTDKTSSTAFSEPETTYLGKTAASIVAGHHTESGFLLLDRGRDALSWRLILADAAEKSIDVMYFLWKNDESGQVLIQRMLAAAERGVRVRALIDDSMTDSDPEYLALFSAHPNVEVRLYKPFGPKKKSIMRWVDYAAHMKVTNRRMHNKLYLVDGSVEIIGGRNMGNEYFEYPGEFVFRSRDLLALGPVVDASGEAFDMYWNSDWAVPIEDVVTHVPSAEEATANRKSLDAMASKSKSYPRGFYDDPANIKTEMAALEKSLLWGKGTLLIDDVPDSNGKPQTHAELDKTGVMIGRAAAESKEEALIQSAYLILEKGGAVALDKLIKQGVKVKLATNSMAANNHLSAFVSYRKQRKKMLAAGAEVYEMRPDAKIERSQFTAEELELHKTFFGLHAKTMVFDRNVVFVGSFNLDPRSVDLNTEMGLLVESAELGRAVADSIENDIAAGNSWQLLLDDNEKLSWVTKENGIITEKFDKDPMTSEAQRLEADALGLIPDASQM
ncbi:MAG: phospholipase D family protein [Arenicellales bacterium]